MFIRLCILLFCLVVVLFEALVLGCCVRCSESHNFASPFLKARLLSIGLTFVSGSLRHLYTSKKDNGRLSMSFSPSSITEETSGGAVLLCCYPPCWLTCNAHYVQSLLSSVLKLAWVGQLSCSHASGLAHPGCLCERQGPFCTALGHQPVSRGSPGEGYLLCLWW
jgi:hypothetical protein